MSIRINPWVPMFVAFIFFSNVAAAQENLPSVSLVASSRSAKKKPGAPQRNSTKSASRKNGPADQVEAVIESILEYSYLSKTISIIQDHRQLLQSLASISEEKCNAGTGNQHDVFMAQLTALKLVGRQAEYEKRLKDSKSLINKLLFRSPETPIEALPMNSPIKELSYSLEELHQLALKNPAHTKQWVKDDLTPPGRDPHGRSSPPGQVSSIIEGNAPSQFYYALEEAYSRASSAQQLMQLYHTSLIPLAGSALDSALDSYQTEATEFQQLIDTVLISLDAQMDYCRAIADYRKAISRIETLTGVDLTGKRKIRMSNDADRDDLELDDTVRDDAAVRDDADVMGNDRND